jgi:hypothetical protein
MEPPVLDEVDAARSCEKRRIGRVRGACRPGGAAWALAREPIERKVSCIDGPDPRLGGRGGRTDMRLEALDGRVLADVPECVRAFADVGRRRFAHRPTLAAALSRLA